MASSLRLFSRSVPRSPVFQSLQATTRPFTQCSLRRAEGRGSSHEKDHTNDRVSKGDTLDVQSANAKAAADAKSSGGGGNATGRGDDAGGKAKAKKEFPEAPDVAIGMQDERGGKGG